jgi:hypothetical protein
VLIAREEAGAQHDVGASVQDRAQEPGILFRVVLEVCVLDKDDVALGPSKSGPESEIEGRRPADSGQQRFDGHPLVEHRNHDRERVQGSPSG